MKIVGLKLSDRQKELYKHADFKSDTQVIIASTGRQVGKTECGLHIAINWMINYVGGVYGFILPTIKQCKKVLKQIKKHLKAVPNIDYNLTDLTVEYKDTMLRFLSAESGDSIRGYTFRGLIVDEACFISDQVFDDNILPTIAKNLSEKGKLVMLSTPKQKGYFYKWVKNPPSGLRSYITQFTSYEGGLISETVLNEIRKNTPEHRFKNEYLAEFIEEGEGIFKYKNCIDFELQNEVPYNPQRRYYAGVDWAAEGKDSTVLTIIDNMGVVVFIQRWQQVDWNIQIREIAAILLRYKAICYAETNGIGNMPTKTLKNSYYSNTLGFQTTNQSKTDIVNKLALDFETNNITIPNNQTLHSELDNFEIKVTAHGTVTYSARTGFHDDMVMSLCIANHKRTKTQGSTWM
jgi:hypothetical protein